MNGKKFHIPFTRREIRAAGCFALLSWLLAVGFRPPTWTMLVAAFFMLFVWTLTEKAKP